MATKIVIPTYNPATCFDDNLQVNIPRSVPAFDFLLGVLAQNLWPWMQSRGMPAETQPTAYQYAGTVVESPFPWILLGASVDNSPFGMGLKTVTEVRITCALNCDLTDEQLRRAFDTLDAVKALLYQPALRGPMVDRDNYAHPVMFYQMLLPGAVSIIDNQNFDRYAGATQHYQMVQTPGSYLWDVDAPGGDT